MTRQFDSKVWSNRSQPFNGNYVIAFPDVHNRSSNNTQRFKQIPVQHVNTNHQRQYEEFCVEDKAKAAQTGRWVLNVIARKEAKQQAKIKKHSFQSKTSSKVEPIGTSSQFYHKHFKNNGEIILSPTTIGDDQTTHLSSFSSATSIDDIRTMGRSSISTRIRSGDCSTDEFKDGEGQPCISKRLMIIFTIISVIFVIGIIVAVFVTIFLNRRDTTDSSAKNINLKSISLNGLICPIELFNITDPLCEGKIPYNYYSCYQMATSSSFTIRFSFQHNTISGHWYFDDISAVQNNNLQLITNGGFESNLTGWITNISSNSTPPETYVDRTTNLSHTGSAYLYGSSKNSLDYIQQTFNVIEGEYINISFWWGYDGGFKLGQTCQAIGQLIPESV